MIIRNLILPAVLSTTFAFGVLVAPDAAYATGKERIVLSKVHKNHGHKHGFGKGHKKHKPHGPHAKPASVPELNGSGLAASMFFLVGGALLLTGRRRIAAV